MAREKHRLGTEKAGKGWRYRRMLKGKTWTSEVFQTLTRQNKADAWQKFTEWREQQVLASKPVRLPFFKPDGVTLDEEAISASGLTGEMATREALLQACQTAYQSLADFLSHAGDQEGSREALSKARVLADDKSLSIGNLFDIFGYISNLPLWQITRHSLPRIRKTRDASLTAKALATEYADSYRERAEAGKGSHGQYSLVKSALDMLTEWFGADRSMEAFDQHAWKRYSSHLKEQIANKKISPASARGYQKAAATFLRHLKSEYAELSHLGTLNLNSTHHRIDAERKEPVLFTTDEIKSLLEASTEKTRLYLLLMLNCGMYQGDIADLKASEIDFTDGRIIRPRSKTRRAKKKGKSPFLFNWCLWPTTRGLLEKHAEREGVALRSKEGRELITHKINDQKVASRNDAIKSAYRRVVDKLKNRGRLPKDWDKPLKSLRKTGANLIAECPDANLSTFFNTYLNHSTVAKESYLQSGRPHTKFDEAVRYIGLQLGQYPTDEQPAAEEQEAGGRSETTNTRKKASRRGS